MYTKPICIRYIVWQRVKKKAIAVVAVSAIRGPLLNTRGVEIKGHVVGGKDILIILQLDPCIGFLLRIIFGKASLQEWS